MSDVVRRVAPLAIALGTTYVNACPGAPPMPPEGAAPTAPTAPPPARHVAIAEQLYDGGLKNGWQDIGWSPRDVRGAPATVRFDNWGGWILGKPGLSGEYGGVVFRVKEPPGESEFLEVHLEAGDGTKLPAVKVKPDDRVDVGGGWVEVLVPMSELDPDDAPFERVVFRAFRPMGRDMVALDKIALVQGSPHVATVLDPAKLPHVAMKVDCRAQARRVSPGIYGVAYYVSADDKRAAAEWLLGATAGRWGGNAMSTYNWELGAFNSGADWFFENHGGASHERVVADDDAHGMTTAITVPMMGWVSKDTTSGSFPVSAFGPQQAVDPSHPEMGNGKDKDGLPVGPSSPTRAYQPITPAFVKRWVQAIRAADEKAGKRRVTMYILDNEPGIWSETHRDAHPEPLTYDELLERTIDYGTAIREADPDAIIAGPAEWGWTGYFYSGKDNHSGGPSARPDRRAHGDVPLVEYYLRRLAEHEKKTGTRVLDVLDLHAYPQAPRVYGDATDSATAALRLRSTRMLWDPSYVDESWIKEPVRLIPRMKQWVDESYPGRGLSIGEWNFGAEGHMSGGLAVAEALGRFAEGGLTYAYYWTYPPEGSPAMWAFRAYRNFDGSGGRFLDFYTPSTVASGATSLFVSRDESGKHLVAVVVNSSRRDAVDADVDLSACGRVASARSYAYEGGRQGFTARPAPASTASGLVQPLAAYSITVLDVDLDGSSSPPR